MLTLQIPMLLALLGTALMAVVIFAPSRAATPVAISFAPPSAPPAFEPWGPLPSAHGDSSPTDSFTTSELLPQADCAAALRDVVSWTAMVDSRAAGCDAAARLGLVEALAAVRTPWSDTILRHALDDEPDPEVRAAVTAALYA